MIPWVHNRLLSWADAADRVEAADPLFYSHKTVEGRLHAGELASVQVYGPVVPVRDFCRDDKAVDQAVRSMPRVQRVAIECRYRGPKEEIDQVLEFRQKVRRGRGAYREAINAAHWFLAGRLT